MQEIQQLVITFLAYVAMFCAFIAGLRAGWFLGKWSLLAAIACCIFANSTTPNDIPNVMLRGCGFTATLGLLFSYIPHWFKSWGLCWRELRLLFQL